MQPVSAGVDGKGVEHCTRHGVGLGHISNAKGGQDAEKGKRAGKYFTVGKELFQIVHGTAIVPAGRVCPTKFDREDHFGKFCHHSQKGTDNHPKDCAGSSCREGGGYADNITYAHRTCKGSRYSRKGVIPSLLFWAG